MQKTTKKKYYKRKDKKPDYCRGCIHEKDDPCRYIHSCPYYQTGITQRKKSRCISCPYGKARPCISYCLKSILERINGKEVISHAG